MLASIRAADGLVLALAQVEETSPDMEGCGERMASLMRDRLIELLCDVKCDGADRREGGCMARVDGGCVIIDRLDMCMIEKIADHLLANGVILQPCKPGDTVYRIFQHNYAVDEYRMQWEKDWTIIRHKFDWDMVPELYKTIFPTYEDAEQALKGCE